MKVSETYNDRSWLVLNMIVTSYQFNILVYMMLILSLMRYICSAVESYLFPYFVICRNLKYC